MEKQSTTKGFAILSIATILGKIFSLLYVPFLQRIITLTGYGVYIATYSVFVLIYAVTTVGISTAISKYIAELVTLENYKSARKAFRLSRTIMFILGIIMTLIMAGGSRILANLVKYPEARISIITLSPTVLFAGLAAVYRGYFQGNQNMNPTAISQVIEQIANVAFSLLFAVLWFPKGVEWAVAGATIGTPVGAFLSLIYLQVIHRKFGKIQGSRTIQGAKTLRKKAIIKRITNIAVPIAISQAVVNGGIVIDLGIVKRRLIASGFQASHATYLNGVLGSYNTLVNVPISIITALSIAVLPGISAVTALNNKNQIVARINYAIKLCMLVAVPSAVGLAALSYPIYRLLFSGAGHELMVYGAFIIIIWSLVQIFSTILQSINRVYVATVYMIIGMIIKIILDYFLTRIPLLNIKGVIIGNIFYYSVPLLLMKRYMKNKVKLNIKILSQLIRPLIAALWMGVAGILSYNLVYRALTLLIGHKLALLIGLVLAVIVSVYLYGGLLIYTGVITDRDINNISPKLKRLLPNFLRTKLKEGLEENANEGIKD